MRLQREAEVRWGEKTVLFMMVGSFYEVYEALVDRRMGSTCGKATEMSRICNIVLTKKNKAVEFSLSNPYMCGFPAYSKVRYVDKLTACGYSVVISDQATTKEGNMERKITAICSPMIPASIIMSAEEEDAQYFSLTPSDQEGAQDPMTDRIGFSVWMDKMNMNQHAACSVVILNLTTGMVGLHETEWSSRDFLELLFMKHCPVEVVWSSGTSSIREHFMEMYPDLKHHTPEKVDALYNEIVYQEKVLQKSFSQKDHATSTMTIHELLELERFPLTTTNLVSFLDFVYQHFPMVIQKLQPPVWDVLSDGVDFLPHIFHELHLLRGKPSVLEIMDCTCTRMGQRRYRAQWFRPLSSASILREKIEQQQRVLDSKLSIDTGRAVLGSLHDWESTIRALTIGRYSLRRMLCLWRDLDALASCVVLPPTCRNDAQKLSGALNESFLRNAMEEHDWSVSMVSAVARKLEDDPKKTMTKQWIQDVAALLGIQGFSSLASILKVLESGGDVCLQFRPSKNVDKKPDALLPDPYSTRKMSGGAVRIYHPEWTRWWANQRSIDQDIEKKHREEFREKAAEWSHTHRQAAQQLMEQIIEVDILWSRVTAAKKHNLSVPVFLGDTGNNVMVGLRNPIVEVVNPRHAFVTNDFTLETGHKGVLLFGQNSSGKSTFVKSLGINIWLAQTGHMVFCDQMCLRPFQSILTKLCVQDDIFRGQSTFVNEMLDLRYILRRCRETMTTQPTKPTLVLADELTAGTETWSATSIVASTLHEFLRAPSVTFVMTTHLHTIHLFKELYADPQLSVRHVHFSRVGVTDPQFRKILPGEGPVMYGIEVAEDLGFSPEFIARCFHYRESMDRHMRRQTMEPAAVVTLVPKKKSRYNKHKIVDSCEQCGTSHDLETHHVVPQAAAVPNPVSGNPVIPTSTGTSIHRASNLRILCRTCHDREHK